MTDQKSAEKGQKTAFEPPQRRPEARTEALSRFIGMLSEEERELLALDPVPRAAQRRLEQLREQRAVARGVFRCLRTGIDG